MQLIRFPKVQVNAALFAKTSVFLHVRGEKQVLLLMSLHGHESAMSGDWELDKRVIETTRPCQFRCPSTMVRFARI